MISASGAVGSVRGSFCGGRRCRLRGQLQHCRMLTYAEMREQHDLSIGELKGIMVRTRIVQVDLPEPRHLVVDLPLALLEKAQLKSRNLSLDLAFERDLGAGKKAHRNLGFSNRREPVRGGIPKLRCDQLVSDLRGSGRNIVQTVVAHVGNSYSYSAPELVFRLPKIHGQIMEHDCPADAHIPG